ncbi:MAG: ATP-binding protein [Desulfobacterales bacterium]|nr:MAG: ATP-binding protein [Desulfobacterales bacterium]
MRQTNWYVITGAPCSGKTAVINELERRGYRVVHETARAYIDRRLNEGLQLEAIKADERQFEGCILEEKLRIESSLPPNETIFFDRGIPDSIAYFKLAGLDAAEPLSKSNLSRYRMIFFFERLEFLKDRVRSENEKTADRLNSLIQESYRLLEYEIIPVPAFSIEQRVEFILKLL